MKRTIISILLTAVMIFPVFVFADDASNIEKQYNVKYDGETLSDNFGDETISELINGMQPGDQVTFTVNVHNDADEADWYISNSVLSSFEDNEKASGGAYTYKLSYKPNGGEEKDLYNSSTTGGESTEHGVGLHQVPEDMEEFFFLDTLGKNGKGTVKLTVGLDGETQNNSYQNADSSVALQFAVYDADEAEQSGSEEPDDDEEESKKKSGARTGDENNLIPYAVTLFIAGAILLLIAVRNLKNEAKEGSTDEK